MTAAIDLTSALYEAWTDHVAVVVGPRGDEDRIHGGDLHGCDFALWQRLRGVAELDPDDGAFTMWERGHAYEARVHEALVAYYVKRGYAVTRGEEVEYEGVVGHIDFAIYDHDSDTPVAIVDCTTTAGKTTDWGYGHALKSAFYAVAKGAPEFFEWVIRIGFGGTIAGYEIHRFRLDDVASDGVSWRERVALAIAQKKAVAALTSPPDAAPPVDPKDFEQETWRCGKPGSGKSYCRARCDYNARWNPL